MSTTTKRPRSTPPPALKKGSKIEAKERIVAMCARASRPLLIGTASLSLGLWTLDETAELFAELVDEGRIRRLTDKESREYDLLEAYVLVQPERLTGT